MIITVKDLYFSYNGKAVLKGVDLEVEEGEFLGILGPNGSGKTTLLKCLNRSLNVPRGKVTVHGKDVRDISRKELARTYAVVEQEVTFGFDFTVEEVVSMGRYPHLGRFEFESPAHGAIVRKAMKYTEVYSLRQKPITKISGGEKQRVMIAMALAQEPRILLLDEPTKNLDIGHTLDILDLIGKNNRSRGVTVVAVLHDLNLAARYCSRVLLLDQGRIFAIGRVRDVLSPRNIARIFGVNAVVQEGGGQLGLRILGRAKAGSLK